MKSTYAIWNMTLILISGFVLAGCNSESAPQQGFHIPENASDTPAVAAMPQPDGNAAVPATKVVGPGTTLLAEHFPDSDFFGHIQDSDTTVVVDFTATWCGPCQKLKPVLKELEEEGKLKVVMIDVDANPGIARSFGVNGIPHLMFVKDGKVAENAIGFKEKEELEAILESLKAPVL